MRVESYDIQIAKTCRKCYTIFDYKRDYCCVKDKFSCFADPILVKKGLRQDQKMAEKLFFKRKVTQDLELLSRIFYGGRLRNECLIFKYRPPGCRSHFCWRWDKYIEEHPRDMVYANLRPVSTKTLLKEIRKDFEYGVELAYPGGTLIYVPDKRKADRVEHEIKSLLDSMKIKHFRTNSHIMDSEKNKKAGVEIIMDKDGIIAKPRLFGTLLKNNIFMLVGMKMNMGSAGFRHSNIMITTADPEKVAEETPASLKSFHALQVYQV
ncbi:MAG: hypothetical protein JSV63_02445 [Candidatus Aenigmatarchaeota archaeon]|nr:MAG: hypothetical protein JSV63_02445 [Candidatus Aenigmarchaeota archaeon]